MTREITPEEAPHGVDSILWSNLGMYFRGQCLCGWETGPSKLIAEIGAEFDEHFDAVSAAARARKG